MIVLENLLTVQELAAIREFLKRAEFVNGKVTADAAIQNRKDNEQLKRGEEGSLPVDQIVAQAFIRNAQFQA